MILSSITINTVGIIVYGIILLVAVIFLIAHIVYFRKSNKKVKEHILKDKKHPKVHIEPEKKIESGHKHWI